MASKSKRRKKRKTSISFRQKVVFGLTLCALAIGLVISVGQSGGLPFDWDDVYQKFGMAADPLPAEELSATENAIHFIDVGQGDAVLLQSDGEYCLIDTGLPDSKDALFHYLDSRGITSLKLLVMSHPHADHIGSMDQVIDRYQVDQILLPDFSKAPIPTSATFERVISSIEKHHIPAVSAKEGQEFDIGDGRLTVLADGIVTDNLNNISQVLYFEAGNLTAVLSGDAEKEAEKDALKRHNLHPAKIFKAGHHGSDTSNSKEFVKTVMPSYVVICCGKDNSYGHPNEKPLELFYSLGAQVLRTDLDGTVVIAEQNGILQSYTSRLSKENAA